MSEFPSALRVLIIDDEPMVRSTLRAFLEDSGYACMEAQNGLEGLECCARHSPDIVLTDLRMPGLDGCGLVRALSLQSPSTPIIVMSGAQDPMLADQLLRLGAHACLPKPLKDLREIEKAIHSSLPAREPGVPR